MGGKFVKGQSGNPGGRKKEPREVQDALKALCPAAVERIKKAISDPLDREGVKAAFGVLERVYGKPKQAVEIAGEGGGPVQFKGTIEIVRKAISSDS